MKKILTICAAAIISTLSFKAKAQTPSANGTTNMHVIIVDALSITVNHPDVTLTFDDALDYQNGRDTTLNNHLTVTSNQPFTINVKAASSNLTAGSNTIATNSVNVKFPATQSSAWNPGVSMSNINLTTTDQALVTGATAAVNQNIDVEYAVPSSISSVAPFLGKPAGDYTTVLTYTITQ